MKRFLHIFFAIAFVLSSASPACAFISGKSATMDIEICTADGLKTVQMPTGEPSDDHAHKKKDDCGFCFAQSNLKLAKADPVKLFTPASLFTTKVETRDSIFVTRFELSGLSARAPPLHA